MKDFHEKSAQTDLSKDMWVSISKGLKHMNTVLKYLWSDFTNTLLGCVIIMSDALVCCVSDVSDKSHA